MPSLQQHPPCFGLDAIVHVAQMLEVGGGVGLNGITRVTQEVNDLGEVRVSPSVIWENQVSTSVGVKTSTRRYTTSLNTKTDNITKGLFSSLFFWMLFVTSMIHDIFLYTTSRGGSFILKLY